MAFLPMIQAPRSGYLKRCASAQALAIGPRVAASAKAANVTFTLLPRARGLQRDGLFIAHIR